MLETVKLTLQIIMGTEGSCKKVMIKLSPSTATKRENIIELLNQRIPIPPTVLCGHPHPCPSSHLPIQVPQLIIDSESFEFSSSISNVITLTNRDLAINGRIDQI